VSEYDARKWGEKSTTGLNQTSSEPVGARLGIQETGKLVKKERAALEEGAGEKRGVGFTRTGDGELII